MNNISRNIHGGGKNTTKNGMKFEQDTDMNSFLEYNGYEIKNKTNIFNGELLCGYSTPKHLLYHYLSDKQIDYKIFNSKKWLSDECIVNEDKKIVFIVEKKYQERSGSVDEKLASMEFKLFEYQKLFNNLKYEVRFIYLLNDWYKNKQYKDVLNYIDSKDKCTYFFNEITIETFQFMR